MSLLENRSDPYIAAGAFDGALTSVLLLIVHEIDRSASMTQKGHTRSARQLLDFIDLRSKGGPVAQVKVVRADGWTTGFEIQTTVLRDALDRTQATRHGRSLPQPLEEHHITALIGLGKHPDITDISAIAAERALDAARTLDDAARVQASSLLERLPDDEISRLAESERLGSLVPFMDSKDSLDWPDYDDCPVCWNVSFQPDGYDYFGGLHSSGQCLVCGYARSEAIAYDEAITTEVHRLASQADS